MTWSFRLRFNLGATSKLESAEPEWVLAPPEDGPPVVLVPADGTGSLAEARRLALRGSGYGSEADAAEAAQAWRERLMLVFARVRVGADFGDRAAHSWFTEQGLAHFSEVRALNDVHGVMVFETDPPPVFLMMGPITGQMSSPHARLEEAMAEVALGPGLTLYRQVAYDLFSASFSQESADARFALLMMALEVLIDPRPRSEQVRAHVDSMILATRASGLPQGEVDSLVGAIRWLGYESIGQAGRRAASSLGPMTYAGDEPAVFFTRCYALRSRLLHGHLPLPTRAEIDALASSLEVFVANLLCHG